MTSTIELRNTLTLDYEVGPFISLFVSFNEISNKEQYLNLIQSVKKYFIQKYDENIWPRYERKLKRFNFNRAKHVESGSGFALYVSFKAIHSFNLTQPVQTKFSIADTMNISQVVKEIESDLHYRVLVLHDDDFKVFRVDNGNCRLINMVNKPLAVLVNHDKRKYYQLIDECLNELFADDDYLPIALVANEDNCKLFSEIATQKMLVKDINYSIDDDKLSAEVFDKVIAHLNELFWDQLMINQKNDYKKAQADNLVVSNLKEIIYNTTSGKIDTLFINEDKYNQTYNDLAITTIGFAGHVFLLPADEMPTDLDCAAIMVKI